jgi:hydrogenase-4 component E
MVNLLIILFLMSLFYISISGRLFVCINLLILQGLILFGVALLSLQEVDLINLLVVLVETLVFKAIILPYYIKKMVLKNKIKRQVSPFISGFSSLMVVSLLIILSFIMGYYLQNAQLKIIFVTAAFSGILAGLFLIISRKEIIQHIIGYIVLENGVVLLSFSMGNETPMAVNAGILLDILISILLFGLFMNRIARTYKDLEIDQLNKLAD